MRIQRSAFRSLEIGSFCAHVQQQVRKRRKKRATPPYQQASEARCFHLKNSTNKGKTASSEAVPLPGDKSGDAGGVDRALSPRSTLVGQGGSDSPLGCHSLPPHSRPIALRTSNKKRSEFSDPSLLADKTNDAVSALIYGYKLRLSSLNGLRGAGVFDCAPLDTR